MEQSESGSGHDPTHGSEERTLERTRQQGHSLPHVRGSVASHLVRVVGSGRPRETLGAGTWVTLTACR